MAESKNIPNNISADDTLDINELASLDGEVSTDFINQLQSQITADAHLKNDGDLFEDIPSKDSKKGPAFNKDIDDNFIKKYKAKLQKQQISASEAAKAEAEAKRKAEEEAKLKAEAEARLKAEQEAKLKAEEEAKLNAAKEKTGETEPDIIKSESDLKPEKESANNKLQDNAVVQEDAAVTNEPLNTETKTETQTDAKNDAKTEAQAEAESQAPVPESKNESINTISGGNITEHPMSIEKANYKESLNFLDNNVKYSKYVIYIDPENKEFIDGLTVKERKNLINRIIREQDSISMTKRKLSKMQAIIVHALIAITTITIFIPIIYWIINASLEATINSYRQSQSAFEVLYKDKGKLKRN